MNATILIAQLVLQYGPAAVNAIASLVHNWGVAEAIPDEAWLTLRDELKKIPDYWDVVKLRGTPK